MVSRKKRSDSERKANTSTLGEAIKDLLQYYRLDQKFDETRLVASWERIMGKAISSRTNKLFVKDKTLFIGVNSAPLKNQLQLSKEKIIDIFEKEIGKGIIEDVRLL